MRAWTTTGLALLLSYTVTAVESPATGIDGFFSEIPAQTWQEALITGNGTMGVMVWGRPSQDQIIFTHERLYEPLQDQPVSPPKLAKYMPRIKRLLMDGKSRDASHYAMDSAKKEGYPGLLWTDPFHPAFVMRLQQPVSGNVRDYQRSVNFMTGEITVSWTDDAGPCLRKTFVSRADQVVVQMIDRGGQPVDVNLTLAMQDPTHKAEDYADFVDMHVSVSELIYRARYTKTTRAYESLTRVVTDGGTREAKDGQLEIKGAKRILLLTRIVSLEDVSRSEIGETRRSLAHLSTYYGVLLNAHRAIHETMYSRVRLDLFGGQDRALSSEALIAQQKASDEIVPALLEKMFNMGRFAFICASGEWPPNLMGIWTGEWQPPWSGDFTLDANLNLQIAACNIGAMPEAMQSYTNLITHLLPDWRVNAEYLYGCHGVLSGTRTDGRHNLQTHASEDFPGFFWTAGAEWLTLPMIEYYEVTGDEQYLRTVLYPLVREIALFYEDFLTETDEQDRFLFVPSYSPENTPSNRNNSACVNATMDIAAAKEALTYAIKFARELGYDQYKVVKWQAMLEKLPPYLINEDGALKEWADPDLKDNYDHRHVSHLYPVWPGHEINPDDTPDLFQAAQVAAQKRGRGNGSAHGLAHMALIGARLKDADLVYGNLRFMLSNDYLLPSLFTYHNPGRIYNADMLCSLPAVVMEMLVYSSPGRVELLPALHEHMKRGVLQGILCRGGIRVNALAWNMNLKRINVTLTSREDQTIQLILRRGFQTYTVTGTTGHEATDTTLMLELPGNKPVSVLLQWDSAEQTQ